MKHVVSILVVLAFAGAWSCGSDPIAAGDAAMASGNYTEAITQYRKAEAADVQAAGLSDKLALAYFREGQNLYQARRVLAALEDRVAKGEAYLTGDPGEEVARGVSDVYVTLAKARYAQIADQPLRAGVILSEAFETLDQARAVYPGNEEAARLQDEWQQGYLDELIAKGRRYLKSAARDKGDFLYAERFLSRAHSLDPGNDDVRTALMEARTGGLNILDPTMQAPIAITDRQHKGKTHTLYVVVANLGDSALAVAPEHFRMVDAGGQNYPGYAPTHLANAITIQDLANGGEAEGGVAFDLPVAATPVRLEFVLDDAVLGTKPLPY